MTPYYSRHKHRRSKNLLGVMLIILVLAVTVGLFYFNLEVSRQQADFDPETLCPVSGSPAYVALVFDKSDAYNRVQQQFLKRYFMTLKAGLEAGTHISLYVIDDRSNKAITADFEVCVPRSGEQANALYENPVQIRKRWLERFETPLDQAIQGFMQPGGAAISPIMEILQVVSLSAFPVKAPAARKRIILVSDMLHHTSQWSHYRAQMDFKELHVLPYFQRLSTDLQGAEVTILYVRRDGREELQNKRHAYFWADYIDAIGGKVVLIEKVDG